MKYLNFLFVLLLLIQADICLATVNNVVGFKKNKGQIKDQFKNARTDIDYVLHSEGLSIFVGAGELHYQFFKNPGLNDAVTDFSNSEVSMYRMDVELIGANRNSVVVEEGKLPYYERYFREGFYGGGIQVNTSKKITYKEIYPNIDWVLYV